MEILNLGIFSISKAFFVVKITGGSNRYYGLHFHKVRFFTLNSMPNVALNASQIAGKTLLMKIFCFPSKTKALMEFPYVLKEVRSKRQFSRQLFTKYLATFFVLV